MPTAEEFDEFYVETRRRIALQTFALTGDLGASRSAVRDAYVAAKHHWPKVGRGSDPESWVRPRAWGMAQRRHTVKVWHRERGISAEQAVVLEVLHQLPDVQRRTLILDRLAGLDVAAIGREIGQTRERTEAHLQSAVEAFSAAMGCRPDSISTQLHRLEPAADAIKLPRPPVIRRNGIRRRRQHTVMGSLVLALLALGAGAFVTVAAPLTRPDVSTLVNTGMLLTSAQVTPLAPGQAWNLKSTSDNTGGTGINTLCQATRFADRNGLGAWIRTFETSTAPRRDLVQTVEISATTDAARATYATTLGWYAGCAVARLQLLDAYTVTGVGEQAQILRLRVPDTTTRSFVIGIARTGALTTSTVLETDTDQPQAAGQLAATLAASVRNLCTSKVAGTCLGTVSTTAALPPPSGETPGMLANADLPAIAAVSYPWVGTDPVDATFNVAATTCDHANFAASGAVKPVTRTFLIPQAILPQRFGLTETLGRFGSAQAATNFVNQVIGRMKACPRRNLGSTVSHQVISAGPGGSTYALWRLENQVNKAEFRVPFWMGITRVGVYVAQVNLTPVMKYDVSQATFQALVTRARDRLFEVH